MSLKQQAFKGLIWTFTEQFGGQIINFVVNLILARTLLPYDFGVLGILFVFITISNVLVDGGMKTSLIRKRDTNEKDYSSVFFANFIFSLMLYFLIFLLAPFVAGFYQKPECTLLLRVFSLSIIFQSFVCVQSAILTKNFDFKKQSLLKLPSIAFSSILGLVLACKGFGVWSLIWMYLTQTFFWAVFHWISCDWKPKIALFDKSLFKYHFNFGYKLSITEIINAIIANIYQIIIGKYYGVFNVGYYTQSLTLRQLPISNIYGPVSKLALPIFSQIKDNKVRLNNTFIQILSVLIVILSPVLLFIAIFSEPILVTFYSEKWRIAAPFLFHLAIAGSLSVICSFILVVLNIIEGSKLILKIESSSKGQILVLALIPSVLNLPLTYVLYSISISAIVSFFIVCFYASKHLNIPYFNLLYVQFRLLFASLTCVLISYFLSIVFFNQIFSQALNLFFSLLIAVFLYLTFTYIFNKPILLSLINFKNSTKNSFQ